MKKAIIDQIFLGFILLSAILTFLATVNDDTSTRNRIYDLKELAKNSSNTIARHYEQQIDMCDAQTINNDILRETTLGNMVLDNSLISYTWYDINKDGQPDRVETTIAQHDHETFWYRFIEKFKFTIGPFSEEEELDVPANVTLSFGSEDAGYNNMMGTYQLDANNCVTNAQLLLENSNAGHSQGDPIGTTFTSPPTYVFLLSNGYDLFANGSDRPRLTDSITVNNHCFNNATSNPSVTLNGITRNNANMYFEHTELNGDGGYEHIQLIPQNALAQYESFIGGINGNDKYQQFLALCETVNKDNDPNNNIPSVDYEENVNDCLVDANGQYTYAMEDLDGGGDQDFNDLMLDSTRVVISSAVNDFTIDKSSTPWKLDLTCQDPNKDPELTLTGCPLIVNEDTASSDITWTATDSDGTIASVTAAANNGTVTVNNDGTLTYQGLLNYSGSDNITVTATDDDGGITFAYCTVTVNEVNDLPTISGTPSTSIVATNLYSFTPVASDVETATANLNFTIQNQPSWATFNTSTGKLSGTPQEADVANSPFTNIIISVIDESGGTTSLAPFDIEVLTSNGRPFIVTPIPDNPNGTAYENNLYTYDVSSHFDDPNSDPLEFSVSGAGSIGTSSGIFSYNIPDSTAGNSIAITVTASDGTLSISDTFILNIINNSNCNGPFEEYFPNESSLVDWAENGGNVRVNGSGRYLIPSGAYAAKAFYFGPGCTDKDITLDFKYKSRNFTGSGKFEVITDSNNYLPVEQYDGTGNSWVDNTVTLKTRSDGWLTLYFYNNSTGRTVRIDNVILESK